MRVKLVFYSLLVIFVLLLSYFTIVPEGIRGMLFFIAAVLAFVFFLLGGYLIYLSFKARKSLKRYMLVTGIGAAGFFLFSILHNVFYALGILFKDIIILKYLMEALHVTFFITSIIVCPIAFLVGSVFLFRKL